VKVSASFILLLHGICQGLHNTVFIALEYVEVVCHSVQGDATTYSTAKRDSVHGFLGPECECEEQSESNALCRVVTEINNKILEQFPFDIFDFFQVGVLTVDSRLNVLLLIHY